MTESIARGLTEIVKRAVVDIEDQVVVYVDPSPPSNTQCFKTKNKAGTVETFHFLWRPSSDMAFRVDDVIDHLDDPYLHKDSGNQVTGTGGQKYDKLTAPFKHSTEAS